MLVLSYKARTTMMYQYNYDMMERPKCLHHNLISLLLEKAILNKISSGLGQEVSLIQQLLAFRQITYPKFDLRYLVKANWISKTW